MKDKQKIKFSKLAMTLAVWLIVSSIEAQGADRTGKYTVHGNGNKSCDAYLQLLPEKMNGITSPSEVILKLTERHDIATWLRGFLTSYNKLKPDTYDIAGNTDFDGVNRLLNFYCKKNPRKSIAEAADWLTIELYPKRIKKHPDSMEITYKVYSYGTDSCGAYIKSWTNLDKYDQKFTSLIYAGWLNGYVTGFNLLKPNIFDIMGNTGLKTLLVWLHNYCKENPHDRFADAVSELIINLYLKRLKKAP